MRLSFSPISQLDEKGGKKERKKKCFLFAFVVLKKIGILKQITLLSVEKNCSK